MISLINHMKKTLAFMALLLSFTATLTHAAVEECVTNCLRVYSIELVDVGTYINGTVKLIDETGGNAGTKSALVHAIWTREDGSTLDVYDVIGTRLRAEFRLQTAAVPGTYMLTVVDATKEGYTFDPLNSALLSATISVGSDTNQSPVAIANADVTSGTAPLTVSFDSNGSFDPDGEIVSYEWDFGDGNTSNELNPAHTYTIVWDYTAILLVTDNLGATSSSMITIKVSDEAACSSDCIIVDDITLSYVERFNRIKGVVAILDENGGKVDEAEVHAVWEHPDGSTIEQFATTTRRSQALFSLTADLAGEYTFTVVEVNKEGFTFDLDNSKELSDSLTIP